MAAGSAFVARPPLDPDARAFRSRKPIIAVQRHTLPMAIFASRRPRSRPPSRRATREAHVVSARELAAQAASRKAGKLPRRRAARRNQPARREHHRLVDGAEGDRSRAGQSGPVRGARERGAAVRQRPGRRGARAARAGRRRPTPTRSSRRSRGSRCSTCMQRANDRAAFDQLAMQYVLQFERSAPVVGRARASRRRDDQARRRRLHRGHRQAVERQRRRSSRA